MAADPDLAHLVPSAQAAALLPDAERLALLRTERWWVAHDRAEAALARLETLLRDGPGQVRPPCLLLAGPTNNGKSWIVERFVRAHELPGGEDAECRPVVAMQMPTEPTVSGFYAALLTHLGAPVAHAGPGGRKQEFEQLALRVLRGVGTRVLVIHELNNMLGGTRTARGEFLDLLRWLGNELCISIVGAGTRDAWLAIRTDPQLENWFEPFVLPAWRPGPEAARLLQGFATLLPLRRPSDLRAPGLWASSRAPAAPSARSRRCCARRRRPPLRAAMSASPRTCWPVPLTAAPPSAARLSSASWRDPEWQATGAPAAAPAAAAARGAVVLGESVGMGVSAATLSLPALGFSHRPASGLRETGRLQSTRHGRAVGGTHRSCSEACGCIVLGI